MNNFSYHNPTRIVFGRDAQARTGELVHRFGKKVLLHYGGGSIKANGVYRQIVASLDAARVDYVELGGVKPNPRLSLVHEGIRLCKEKGVDFILAAGGGSVIDSAKGIAAGVLHDGDIWDLYLDPNRQPEMALPIGVVLTIPAAGSESSTGSVVTKEDEKLKRDIGSECLIPRFAIMNPEFTYGLPPYQTACGASDILAHMLERYFTQVRHVDLTDRLLEGAMRTIIQFAPVALREPENYDARAEIMWTGTIAHNNLLDTGRVGDWASHNIEHELSGEYDIAHGAGLSIVFPAWMRYVYKENIGRFVQFAVRVFDVDWSLTDQDAIVMEMVRRLEAWYKRLGLPVRLSEVGIGDEALMAMAQRCLMNRDSVGNFKVLRTREIYEIYKLAL